MSAFAQSGQRGEFLWSKEDESIKYYRWSLDGSEWTVTTETSIRTTVKEDSVFILEASYDGIHWSEATHLHFLNAHQKDDSSLKLWSWNGMEDNSYHRFSLDGEEPLLCQMPGHVNSLVVRGLDEEKSHALRMDVSEDGLVWREKHLLLSPLDISAPSGGKRFSVALLAGTSHHKVRFDDIPDMSSTYAYGLKGEMGIGLGHDWSSLLKGNFQMIGYEGYDYLEWCGLLCLRKQWTLTKDSKLSFSLSGGENWVNILSRTAHYPVVSAEAGLDLWVLRNLALAFRLEANVSFQRDSFTGHYGAYAGVALGL